MTTLNEYQLQAEKTDKNKRRKGENALIIPILGLTSEAGSVATEFKKRLRDGESHKHFKETISEELGDTLWYLANTATKLGITLEEIASSNIAKIEERWAEKEAYSARNKFFDDDFPEKQQLPRKFEVVFKEVEDGGRIKVAMTFNGEGLGSKLTDNSYSNDGYRYHDIFHLSYYALLGWSPVIRALLKRKRKKDPAVDEVEDGARAWILEEGISAYIYNHADKHNFYKGIKDLDYNLLKTVKLMVSGLEVNVCTTGDWEKAIFKGYDMFRQLWKNKGGKIRGNMHNKSLTYSKL